MVVAPVPQPMSMSRWPSESCDGSAIHSRTSSVASTGRHRARLVRVRLVRKRATASTFALAALAITATAGYATAGSPLLRWEGHTVRSTLGPAPACQSERCGPPKRTRFPLAPAARITIIHEEGVTGVTARLVRADRHATKVGPLLVAQRHSGVRSRLTLPRDLRRAKLIEITTESQTAGTRTFHAYVTR